MQIDDLLRQMVSLNASDLHLKVGNPPVYRVNGELSRSSMSKLTQDDIRELVRQLINDEQRDKLNETRELDLAYTLSGTARFRVNVFIQKGLVGVVARLIPIRIKTLAELGMPPILKELAERPRGLVLVTGPTGSGKSTTLAAMINHINETEAAHIMTIEDPVEFVHEDKKCIVNQREIGADSLSFSEALKHVLRQDPDVILVGEMRDLETISSAITAAETGHMVFATLHTTNAPQTIDRIIDVFPPHQQAQVRSQLGMTLEGVISQTLVPSAEGKGRACALEIMVATPAIRNLIREGKTFQLASAIQTGGSQSMQSLDQALFNLFKTGKISKEDALSRCSNIEAFNALR